MNSCTDYLDRLCAACLRDEKEESARLAEVILVELELPKDFENELLELRRTRSLAHIKRILLGLVKGRFIKDLTLKIHAICTLGLSRQLDLNEVAKLITEIPRDQHKLMDTKERRIWEVCNFVLIDVGEGRMEVDDDDLLRVELRSFILKGSK